MNSSSLFKSVKILWPHMCAAGIVDASTGMLSLDPRLVADNVIGRMWSEVQFEKHCGTSFKNTDFETVYKFLNGLGSISAFRRERLITPGQICCLVKNASWCINYWSEPENCKCAVHGGVDYGFKQSHPGARVQFDDMKPLPTRRPKKTSVAMTMPSSWAVKS